jgi:hypothetical protein
VYQGAPGEDCQMLRPDRKAHQQDVPWEHVENALKPRLLVKRCLEHPAERLARIAFVVDGVDAVFRSDV